MAMSLPRSGDSIRSVRTVRVFSVWIPEASEMELGVICGHY